MLQIIQIPALKDNYIYLFHDALTGKNAVIDPTLAEPVLAIVQEKKWQLDYVLNTHHHHDHIGGNLALKAATGCRIIGFQGDAHRIPGIDQRVEEGEKIAVGSILFNVLFLPGHTFGHIAYWSPAEKLIFCGDVLFSLGCGRLLEGNAAQMYRSLQQLMALPNDTLLYCAHEYTEVNGQFALSLEPENRDLERRMEEVRELRKKGKPTVPSSLEMEKRTNPFLRADSLEIQRSLGMQGMGGEEVFREIRKRRDRY